MGTSLSKSDLKLVLESAGRGDNHLGPRGVQSGTSHAPCHDLNAQGSADPGQPALEGSAGPRWSSGRLQSFASFS